MLKYLKDLTELAGPSGNEDNVREYIKEKISSKVDEVITDRMGNLIALKKGKGSGKKILLDAHMDEVGFLITNINEDGTLSFAPVGGVDTRVVIGKKVKVGKDVIGIIGYKAIHLQRDGYLSTPKYSELKIDIGAKSKAEAEKLVKIGDYVSFVTSYEERGDYIIAKALDDRCGCSVLMDLIEEGIETDHDVYFAFTVQEETGLRGPAIIAEQFKVDIAIAVETTTSGDDPELERQLWSTHLGDGPAITFMHSGYVVNQTIFEKLVETAKQNNIPFQYKMRTVGGTNARRYALTGIPAGVVSVPARYIHSPVSIINKKDYEHTLALLREFLRRNDF
ncbi:M42 family metallopeptidase [Fervidobacterium islandicum]|uniref:M42 family metallopeptidase n=1 Tax=Fervidobacterium islandicum TaxID=2423 RepID=UPI003A75BC26